MNFIKNFYNREKKLMNKPGVILPVWIGVGFVLGIGMDNIGAGVAIGIVIGAALYSTRRKSSQENVPDENDSQNPE